GGERFSFGARTDRGAPGKQPQLDGDRALRPRQDAARGTEAAPGDPDAGARAADPGAIGAEPRERRRDALCARPGVVAGRRGARAGVDPGHDGARELPEAARRSQAGARDRRLVGRQIVEITTVSQSGGRNPLRLPTLSWTPTTK